MLKDRKAPILFGGALQATGGSQTRPYQNRRGRVECPFLFCTGLPNTLYASPGLISDFNW